MFVGFRTDFRSRDSTRTSGGNIAASKQVKFAANSGKHSPIRRNRPGFETVFWQRTVHAQ